jgi:cellulose synthase (UDP-forming)
VQTLPWRIVVVYSALAAACVLPVLLVDGVTEARGFYLLSVINALLYTAIVTVIVIRHYRDHGIDWRGQPRTAMLQFGSIAALCLMVAGALSQRAEESLHALMVGLEPLRLTRALHVAAGAGAGKVGDVRFIFDPGWN